MSNLTLVPIGILLIGAFLIYVVGRLEVSRKIKGATAYITTMFLGAAFLVLLMLVQDVWDNPTTALTSVNISTGGDSPFTVRLRADSLSCFIALLSVGFATLVAFYSSAYMEKNHQPEKFYSLLTIMTGAIVGMMFAVDIFTIWVFFEMMCIASYVLVAFEKEKWEPIEAAFKYLVLSSLGSAAVLLGVSLIYSETGTLSLIELMGPPSQPGSLASFSPLTKPLIAAVVLIITGFGVKAAMVPLHTWLPDAHSAAPSPISAMLSGIVIESGFMVMIKNLLPFYNTIVSQDSAGGNNTLSFGMVLCILAIITMTVGNIMALRQKDIKRMLAYSSIAQMGYIMLGFGLGFNYFVASGFTGGLFHILTHTFMKGLAFLVAGAIIHQIGTREISKMKGIASTMPVSAFCLTIAALALAGVPPLSGFMSKWIIYKAGFDAGASLFTFIAILNSVISLGYYVPLIFTMYSKEPSPESKRASECNWRMLFVIIILTIITIMLGILPQFGLVLVDPAVNYILSVMRGV